ncbi:MAG TPA: hypothetical protein VNZ26_06065, partial [Vicinamibacterales bacterium]|nr:hypothetical protein [Vicinamibacterales bacterium]
TGLSVAVALFVGTIELASIVSGRIFDVHSGVWGAMQQIDFQTMGYMVAALFVACWLLSMAVWRFGRFGDRWRCKEAAAEPPTTSAWGWGPRQ